MATKRTQKHRREVVEDSDGHPVLSDAERLCQAAPPAEPAVLADHRVQRLRRDRGARHRA